VLWQVILGVVATLRCFDPDTVQELDEDSRSGTCSTYVSLSPMGEPLVQQESTVLFPGSTLGQSV
jgi:hypothetical protein